MSRKTAVCLLFVLVLAVLATAAPAQAGAWQPGVSGADAPAAVWGATTANLDPDGVSAPDPTAPGGFLLDLMRFLLTSLVL